MKVIFLDFDGVLVSLRSIKNKEIEEKADPSAVKALNKLLKATGAEIVVSSTWRMYGPRKTREILIGWGVRGSMLGVTPELHKQYGALWTAETRTNEIARWLRDYPSTAEPIEGYVILDDDPIETPYDRHYVQTFFETGFTLKQVDEAIALMAYKPTIEIA